MIYLDASSGIAGDMFTAALVHLGANKMKIQRSLQPIAKVRFKDVRKKGVDAVGFDVDFEPTSHDYVDLVRSIKSLGLRPKAQALAVRILRILAEAESKAHAIEVHRVHLHEAVDCAVDAAAAALALDDLGLLDEEFVSSVVACGMIAPATMHILKEYGIPVRFVSDKELVTPTGAAILAALVSDYMQVDYDESAAGAGTMSLPWPNVLRLARVYPKAVLETNIDDCTPEHVSYMMSSLMDSKALDVHVLPCMMKKGRIGFLVRVLTDRPSEHAAIIMAETGTLGVRVVPVQGRYEMKRKPGNMKIRFGQKLESIRLKESSLGFKPEFDDVAMIAKRHGITFRQAMDMIRRCKQVNGA
jgi:uncharacterized protein (TIGR00299 family) protein